MKKVVIIGGGFAGACAARKLEKNFDVTLIDTKNYFEFTPGILRTIVEPEHVKKVQVLHSHYLHKAKIIIDDVINLTSKDIITKKGRIKFDYLIISSGSGYNTPFKEKDLVISTRAHHLRDNYKKLCKANKILIIGGGLVGVEIAAEIATHYKDKDITIVHSHSRLMERQPLKASVYSEKFLKNKGVKLMFNDKVVKTNENHFVTRNGVNLNPDMAFLCVGITSNSSFLTHNFSDKLDENRQVKVNNYCQVEGHKNIFVAGDIAAVKEEKTAQNAERQSEITVKNILAMENGRKLSEYMSKKRPMVISLGKNIGILTYKNFILTGFVPGILKRFIEFKTMIKYK